MKFFSEFIQKLIRTSDHYKSIYQVSKLQLQQFLRYFADKVKCPKLQRAITLEAFFKIYSKVSQVVYSSLPIYVSSFKALPLISASKRNCEAVPRTVECSTCRRTILDYRCDCDVCDQQSLCGSVLIVKNNKRPVIWQILTWRPCR